MQSDWPARTFRELIEQGVLEVGDGYRAKNDELGGEGLIFLRAGHVTDTHIDFTGVERFVYAGRERFGAKVACPGDVVVTTKGNSTGRVAFVSKDMPPFVYSPHLSYWRSKSVALLRPGFLRAWSRGSEFAAQLQAMCRSTDMAPYLSLSDQQRLRITLPPADVQLGISELGDAVATRIDLLRQTNATLEAIAQALFKSWFIDFDPVRAKSEGREPEGLGASTAALFPTDFEESALGLIPKGWTVGTFGDLANFEKASVTPLATPEVEFEHYSLPSFDADQLPVFELGETIKSNKTRVPIGAVLQSKLNPHIPRVWLPSNIGKRAICSTEFLPWVAKDGATAELVYCTLSGPSFIAAVRTLVTGTSNSHQRVNPDQVAALRLPLAPQQVCEAFTQAARPLLQKVGENRLLARTLGQIRDALLPRLISGKLRLPQAEGPVEEALA